MDWIVYILKCSDSSLYTGITNNIANRVRAHQNGKGAKYTRGRGPFKIIYQEQYATRSAASKRELEIKSLNHQEKLKLKSNSFPTA
jgi:putative endonuclease|tara:strand:- start:417 stop:674 length:258 start_codon:yes stop_codon:yes gene_type:complete